MKYIFILLLYSFPVCVFRQNNTSFKVLYKLEYLSDSTSLNSKRIDLLELLGNNEESWFRSISTGVRDSVTFYNMTTHSQASYNFISYHIHKNTNQITFYDKIRMGFRDQYFYQESKEVMNWTILPDTLTIGDLKCQKATIQLVGRSWIAYFSLDIPISDGPYKFCGLPGLIVSIEDITKTWKFSMLSFQELDLAPFNFKFLSTAEKTDKIKYLKNKRYYVDHLIQVEEAAGEMTFNNGENRDEQIKFRKGVAKKDNNWIELYP